MFRLNYCLPLTLSLLLVPLLADAQILNPSFEAPALTSGAFRFGAMDDWSGDGSHGVWSPGAGFFDTAVPDGHQIGFTSGSGVAQQLTEKLQHNSYIFSAKIGQRNDNFIGTASLELWAGGTVTNGNVIGGTLLSSALLRPNIEQVRGHFVDGSTTYTSSANDPLIGQILTVRIGSPNAGQINFDLVSFTIAPVPAPSALAAFVIGAVPGAVILLRRRRKA